MGKLFKSRDEKGGIGGNKRERKIMNKSEKNYIYESDKENGNKIIQFIKNYQMVDWRTAWFTIPYRSSKQVENGREL